MAGKITVAITLNGTEANAQAIATYLKNNQQLLAIDQLANVVVSYENGF